MAIRKAKVTEFTPDARNANQGTVRGLAMLDDSLRSYGAGRSILVDKNGKIVAGNKTAERAVDIGLTDALVVPTDGNTLVVVQRTDIDLDTPKGRALALADNRVGEIDLSWNPEVLQDLVSDGLDLGAFFNDGELAHVLNHGEDLDYSTAWQGMPEFEQNSTPAFKTLIVHFDNQADLDRFAELVKQTVTMKTRYIWYPFKPDNDNTKYRVEDES